MRRHAFTLTELYLSLAAVAIVAAILYEVTSRPRERVHRSSCSSQGKQISLGTLQYASDFDECLPPSTARATWRQRQETYMKNTLVYRCPVDDGLNTLPGLGLDPGGYHSSFLANVNLCRPASAVPLATLGDPAKTVLQCEFDAGANARSTPVLGRRSTFGLHHGLDLRDDYRVGTLTASTATLAERDGPNRERHPHGLTVSFADGHVKVMHKRQLRNGDRPDSDGLFNPEGIP